jgi:hypothetical protein
VDLRELWHAFHGENGDRVVYEDVKRIAKRASTGWRSCHNRRNWSVDSRLVLRDEGFRPKVPPWYLLFLVLLFAYACHWTDTNSTSQPDFCFCKRTTIVRRSRRGGSYLGFGSKDLHGLDLALALVSFLVLFPPFVLS